MSVSTLSNNFGRDNRNFPIVGLDCAQDITPASHSPTTSMMPLFIVSIEVAGSKMDLLQ